MKKRHLVVAVVSILAFSSSTMAMAEGGSHRRIGGYEHTGSVPPIGLSSNPGVLTIDTSTAVPQFIFDTHTVTPHIDFETSTATTHFDFETSTATAGFDDEPGVSEDGQSGDDFLPATNSIPTIAGLPAIPGIPPVVPSGIVKPHAKTNDDNQDHPDPSSTQSLDESQD